MKKEKRTNKEAEKYVKYAKETMNVSIGRAVGIAAVTSIAQYALLWVLQGYKDISIVGYVVTIFTDRGWIPYVITFAFWLGIWILVLKRPLIEKEMNAFKYMNCPELSGESPIDPETADTIYKKINSLSTEQRQRMLIRRVEAASLHVINTQSTSEVGDVLTAMSDVDRGIVDTSYSAVRYLVWIVPILGFIGTVLGISAAIGGFGSMIAEGVMVDIAALGPQLGDVTRNLGIAFETTLLGLVLAGILTGVMHVVLKREENLLSAVDDYCVSKIVNQIKIPKSEPQDVMPMFEELQNEFTKLFDDVSAILERGEALKGVVKGIDEVADFNLLLQQLQQRLQEQQEQQNGIHKALVQNSEVLITLSQHMESLQQLQNVVERNSEMMERLMPPIKSISKGIPITIGGSMVSVLQPEE